MKPTPVLFVALLAGLPLVQAVIDWRHDGHVQALDVFHSLKEEDLRKFEDELRENSLLHTELAPWLQLELTNVLKRGNEKAIVGVDGTLHLAADLDSISGASYLERKSNPVDAIVDFKRQLEERGVELLLLPTPEKTAVMPRTLSSAIEQDQIPHPDTDEFYAQLSNAGVEVINLFEFYRALPEPLYLSQDTHWTTPTMERVAAEIARRARGLVEVPKTHTWKVEAESLYSSGDLLGMLNYPGNRGPYLLMQHETHHVVDANSGIECEPDRDSPVLLLGDSFTRAFSDPELGLGNHAGLAEHLAKELETTIDVIAIAGGASRTVRESLARRDEVLAGKKLVVWQFSMRDLPVDSNRWDPVDLGEVKVAPLAEGQIEVTAEITEVTRVDNFEYAFGLAVFEYRVTETHAGDVSTDTLWIAHIAVQDFKGTESASFDIGDTQRLVLEPIEKHYDLESTSWADDTDAGFDIWFPIRLVE